MSYFTQTEALALLTLLLTFGILIGYWILKMQRQVLNLHTEIRHIRKSNEELILATNNLTAESVNATSLNSLGFRFPVFLGGPSIDTHHARNLLFLLQERKPRRILELGSGSSTVIIARTLQIMNAQPELHISVDHELRFLENTRKLAELNEVEELIHFEHCPLQLTDGFNTPWYSRIPDLANSVKFDLILIDGPPAYAVGDGRAREPALSIMRPHLSECAIVILDDANRPGEREVIAAWQKAFPEFNLHYAREGKGMAIFTLNNQY